MEIQKKSVDCSLPKEQLHRKKLDKKRQSPYETIAFFYF